MAEDNRDRLEKGEREEHQPAGLSSPPYPPFTAPNSANTGEQNPPHTNPPFHLTPHVSPPVIPASRELPPHSMPLPTIPASMLVPHYNLPPMMPGLREVPHYPQTMGEKNFAELGLGKALDATNSHPWTSKSSYQAKEVLVNDLVVTKEGPNMKHFVEVIEDYFNVQGSLESSVQLPHQPVNVAIAADAHRSKSKLTVMKGKTVSTRTISFPITAVNAHEGTEEVKTLHSPFQCQLERHMELERQREESNDTKLCLDFLHKLGGITHYISSITLGAMEYSVYEVQTLDVGSKVNSKGGFGPLVTVSLPLSVKKKSRKQRHKMENIGWIQPNNHVLSQDEAVISFSIMPLANLVSEEKLRRSMQNATQLYISSRLHKINGPYYIMTPEKTLGGKLGRKNIYWKVEVSEDVEVHYFINHTQNKDEATEFYIRPDYKSTCKYFFITTCAEPRSNAEAQSQQEEGVERYVHVGQRSGFKHLPGDSRVRLEAKAAVKPRFARFQLIDRRDRHAKPLLESDWLPDEQENQGQPFFLCQYYHLSKCLSVTGIDGNQGQPPFMLCRKSRHCEGKCHMLFKLIRPENTMPENAMPENAMPEKPVPEMQT